MARTFWSGTLGFGLVEIPVQLHSAEQSRDLKFSLLDRENLAPVGYKHFNKKTGEDITWDRVVRGYEYEKGEFVVLSDADFERANPEATQSIQILGFVERQEIDPVYFTTPYYIAPQKRGSRSYHLLREALLRTDRVGIARVVLRTREHLAAIMPRGGLLAMDLMRWSHELVKPEDLDIPEPSGKSAKPTEAELKMAERLIEDMAQKWNPEEYRDEYRDDLMRLIDDKVKSGKTHVIEDARPRRRERAATDVVDLMPLLKQSLAEHGRAAGTARRRGPRRAPARGAKTPAAGAKTPRRRSA